ncbi:MAG: DUF2269 family protein, partial [Candidatus Limnocylindrales bacterium]
APTRRFGRRTRNAVLTAHIVVSVGLLGDSAGFLAVAIRRETSDDPAFVDAAHDLLGMFALVFGIPLSFLALLTGVALGLGTPWGLFRYPWVVTKLVLIVTVILVGAIVLRPVLADEPTSDGIALIIGAAYDVAALALATALAVFKPGRARRRSPPRLAPDVTSAATNDR